jgi:L-rhamnose-H+ transport protein
MLAGMAWILLASFFLGTFALPAKYIKNYAWENTWGAFFFFAMLVVPLGFALVALNGLWQTYSQVPAEIILGVMALGFLWGCGFCLWGYGLATLGLSLGYALTMGTMALCGSMLPFFMGNPSDGSTLSGLFAINTERASTSGGLTVIAGILVCIVGVAINGIAGMKRENAFRAGATDDRAETNTLVGVIVCILAGLLSSGCNIAFHIGSVGGIATISVEQYNNPAWMGGLSVWTLIFLGGLISSLGFSLIRLFHNNSWKNFANPGTGVNLFLAFLMAVGHFACLFFYGLGGWMLGALGTSVGFAIFQSGSVLIGNGLGFATGEWKGASSESKGWLAAGLAVLIAGIVVVSIGNTMI